MTTDGVVQSLRACSAPNSNNRKKNMWAQNPTPIESSKTGTELTWSKIHERIQCVDEKIKIDPFFKSLNSKAWCTVGDVRVMMRYFEKRCLIITEELIVDNTYIIDKRDQEPETSTLEAEVCGGTNIDMVSATLNMSEVATNLKLDRDFDVVMLYEVDHWVYAVKK